MIVFNNIFFSWATLNSHHLNPYNYLMMRLVNYNFFYDRSQRTWQRMTLNVCQTSLWINQTKWRHEIFQNQPCTRWDIYKNFVESKEAGKKTLKTLCRTGSHTKNNNIGHEEGVIFIRNRFVSNIFVYFECIRHQIFVSF